MREQYKTLEEEISEMKISNIPDKEFGNDHKDNQHIQDKNDKNSENFNKELENIKKIQTELKNTITKIKNTLVLQ